MPEKPVEVFVPLSELDSLDQRSSPVLPNCQTLPANTYD
ncbi:hypothetical protein CPter91_3232 [Collimonas pratensis]|uniref:Uncharacterized protein n=1 Tax=Collimonas pratensis TaxID=279113 RepID=A0A127Q6B0_9BURK|nr:hypothetical protein CPter91_3232 [Collimonas pratensis]